MIIIDNYKVSDNGKWLIIDLKVNPEFPNAYITSLKVSCDGSFTDAITTTFDERIAEQVDFSTNPTEVHIRLDIDGIINPFFMQVIVDGQEPSTCAYKKVTETATFYKYPIYKILACLIKELDGCEPPQHFLDLLFRLEALKTSIELYDVSKINYYYKWFILHKVVDAPTKYHKTKKPCGCGK